VDIVQNVLEMGDIPRSLKIAGDTLIDKFKLTKTQNVGADLAQNYLRLQFGLKPLVKDIQRTLDFSDHVMKRIEVIKKLQSTHGYRRTVNLDDLSSSQTNNIYLQTAGVTLGATVQTVGHRKIRGHVRWLPVGDYSHLSQVEMLAMARQAVFGVGIDFSSLWEAMPWSWLIDWYTNCGDLLMQLRNEIPCTVDSVSIIRNTYSESIFPSYTGPEFRYSAGQVAKERKERYPGPSLAFDAHLPFLGADQMGILASLLVMKRKVSLNPIDGSLRPF